MIKILSPNSGSQKIPTTSQIGGITEGYQKQMVKRIKAKPKFTDYLAKIFSPHDSELKLLNEVPLAEMNCKKTPATIKVVQNTVKLAINTKKHQDMI